MREEPVHPSVVQKIRGWGLMLPTYSRDFMTTVDFIENGYNGAAKLTMAERIKRLRAEQDRLTGKTVIFKKRKVVVRSVVPRVRLLEEYVDEETRKKTGYFVAKFGSEAADTKLLISCDEPNESS